MQVGLNPWPGSTGESKGCAVLVLTQQVSHFFIRCLFHLGRLVNLFICQVMLEHYGNGRLLRGTLQGGLISFF